MQNTEHENKMCESCERLRAALEPFANIGRDLVRVGAVTIPDGASARYLKLDGIEARHLREAARAVGFEQAAKGTDG